MPGRWRRVTPTYAYEAGEPSRAAELAEALAFEGNADDEYGDDGYDDDPSCTVCGGEVWVECDDPIQCTYAGCDGELHPDPCCQGTGLASRQVIW